MATSSDHEPDLALDATLYRWRRFVAVVVVGLVLAGGIYPALYAGQLPHDHIFIGGAPPANWEEHEHASALDFIFGRADGAPLLALIPVSAATPARSTTTTWASGHVVSVYASSGSLLVLTIVGYALIAPLLYRLAATARVLRVFQFTPDLAQQTAGRPVPPPPRAR